MHERREPVTFTWDGPLPTRDLPNQPLYDVQLRLSHDLATPEAASALASALEAVAGPAKVRKLPLVGTQVRTTTKLPMRIRVKDGEAHLVLDQRLKGKRLLRLVTALAAVPGARDLQIEAEQTTFDAPYSDLRPCSPCAAKSFPR